MFFTVYQQAKAKKAYDEARARLLGAEAARREAERKRRERQRALLASFADSVRAESRVVDLERGADGVYRPCED